MLVLVDTPGFMPGTRQEKAGVIRFGATLVHAFAAKYTDEHLCPRVAASAGYIDELIEPSQTRSRLVWAFGSLRGAA